MASGHVNRTYRPNPWLHRPMLQSVKKALANSEPSTHGTERTWPDVRVVSASGGWSQPVGATLYLKGKDGVWRWIRDFVEGLQRRRRRSCGIAGSGASRCDWTGFWQAVIVDLFSGCPAWWDSSCRAAAVQAGIDARGARGDFQRYYGTSIGAIDG